MDELYTAPTLGELVLRSVKRYRDRVAFVFDDREITYREMGDRISQIMLAMKEAGLARGAGLCLLSSTRPETFYVRIAANLLGVRFTALHPMGSASDQAYILADSQAYALIVDETFTGQGRKITEALSHPVNVYGLGSDALGADLLAAALRHEPVSLWCEAVPSDLSGLVYTGGTTGRSKGVMHTHRSTVANILMCLAEWEWPKEVRLLVMTPLSHAAGALVVPVLVRGGAIYLQDGFEPEAMLRCVAENRITVTFLVPTMIYVLLDHPGLRDADVSSLELVIYGASPMSPTRLLEALDIFGPVFMQLYAQSEAPMTVTTLNTWDHVPDRLASCGQPMVGVHVKLLDDDDQEVPTGEVGEICVRGPLVMEGYWNKPEETAAALRGDWLHTGDMAYQDEDGFYYIVDRKKDMIISGGFNVFPKEIEDVLTAHPSVADAAVISVPDDKWGEAVKAVVILRPGMEASEMELIAAVRDAKGAVYSPKSIDFSDSLPVTRLGKPDKKALRARYWSEDTRHVH